MLQSATQITDEEKGIGSVCFDITLHFHFLFLLSYFWPSFSKTRKGKTLKCSNLQV